MDAHRIAEQETDTPGLRALSLDQRGELIMAACRAAAALERGRIASGLPPSQPVPWPESTWALLRKYAPYGQDRPADP
ncbi:MAG: hypothetical protein MUF25_22145 [Pirellulaceae bacterium]|nr:hypothetical protein [Pirellulaceae bacterium]